MDRWPWEYKMLCVPRNDPERAGYQLTMAGADGWELVGIVPGPRRTEKFYMKRLVH